MNLTAISTFRKIWIYMNVDHHQGAPVSLRTNQIIY